MAATNTRANALMDARLDTVFPYLDRQDTSIPPAQWSFGLYANADASAEDHTAQGAVLVEDFWPASADGGAVKRAAATHLLCTALNTMGFADCYHVKGIARSNSDALSSGQFLVMFRTGTLANRFVHLAKSGALQWGYPLVLSPII